MKRSGLLVISSIVGASIALFSVSCFSSSSITANKTDFVDYCTGPNDSNCVFKIDANGNVYANNLFSAEGFGASPSASAAVNTTAIQNALNQTGLVTLTACGTYQINKHLVIKSNTYFKVASCVTIQLAPNINDNLIINNAYANRGYVSGTIAYLSGTSGCPTNTTIYGVPSYLTQAGSTSISGYAAYGSISTNGSGVPTGNFTFSGSGGGWYTTVPSSITTFYDVNGNADSCSGTAVFNPAGATVTGNMTNITISGSTSTLVNAIWNNNNLIPGQSAVIIFGQTNPTQFNGVFIVESTPTANTFTYRTNRLITSPPSGQTVAMLADTNITIDGGTWDGNGPNENSNGLITGIGIIIGGAYNTHIKNIKCLNTQQNCINEGMVRGFYISDSGDGGPLDRQFNKGYGPEIEADISNIHTVGQDDGVTYMITDGAAAFGGLSWSYGDVMNAGFDHVDGMRQGYPLAASGIVDFFASNLAYMGGVYAKHITGMASPRDSKSTSSAAIACVSLSGIDTAASIDSFNGEDINCNASWSFATGGSGTLVINDLKLDQLTCNQQSANGGNANPQTGNQTCVDFNSNTQFNNWSIDHMVISNQGNTSQADYMIIAGTATTGRIMNSDFASNTGANATYLVQPLSGAVIGNLTFDNITTNAQLGLYQGNNTLTSTPNLALTNSNIAASTAFNMNMAANITLLNNKFTGATSGIVRQNASVTTNIYSFGNQLSGGSLYTAVAGGSPVFNLYDPANASGTVNASTVTATFFGNVNNQSINGVFLASNTVTSGSSVTVNVSNFPAFNRYIVNVNLTNASGGAASAFLHVNQDNGSTSYGYNIGGYDNGASTNSFCGNAGASAYALTAVGAGNNNNDWANADFFHGIYNISLQGIQLIDGYATYTGKQANNGVQVNSGGTYNSGNIVTSIQAWVGSAGGCTSQTDPLTGTTGTLTVYGATN